ncbi:MAG: tetratricopeptide repeat protein [Casimicrobiaceae bacterium]
MPRVAALLLALLCCTAAFGQPSPYESRADALKGLASPAEADRAAAVIWIAHFGILADDAALQRRLSDDSPVVRELAEQGLWLLWSRSGDKAIDELMAKGAEEMQARHFKESIAIYSEVIRRKPAFAEGWNRRATALFLAGDFKRSLADCDQVMKRNPRHFGALAGYGQIYFQMKQYDKAIMYWQRALQANPNMVALEANIEVAEKLLAEQRKHSA